MSGEIFDCLKRERDISVSTTMILPSQNMAFMLTPSLIQILLADTLKTPRSSCHFVNEGTLLRYSLSYLSQNRQIEKAIANQHIDQPTAVSDHFTLPAHSMDNIELVSLELITSNRECCSQGKRSISNFLGQDP